MDERTWLTGDDFRGMIAHLRDEHRAARTKAGKRKLRLFQAACFRMIWDLLPPQLRPVVEALEQDADGRPVEGGMGRLYAVVMQSHTPAIADSTTQHCIHFGLMQAVIPGSPAQAADRIARYVEMAVSSSGLPLRASARTCLCELLRDVFGNPFRPLPRRKFPAEVVGLAQACYDDHSHYPVLADALDDLGEPEMAAHCRLSGHVRGCHVVDHVLGKG
jgi:hypothetical protein